MTGADTERLQDMFIVLTVRLVSVHSLSVQSFSMKVLRKVAVQASVQIACTHVASFFVRPASLLSCGQKHLFDEQPRIAYTGWLQWILAAVTMRDFGNPDSHGIEMLWPVYPNDDFPNQTWPTSTWFVCLEIFDLLVPRSRDCNRNCSTTPSSCRHTRLFSVDVHGSRPFATGLWSPRLLSLVLVLSAPFCLGSPLCLPWHSAVLWAFGLPPRPVHALRHCCHRICPSTGHCHRGPSQLERFRFRRTSLQATLALHGCRIAFSSFSAGVYIPRHQATQASSCLGSLLGELEFLRDGLSSLVLMFFDKYAPEFVSAWARVRNDAEGQPFAMHQLFIVFVVAAVLHWFVAEPVQLLVQRLAKYSSLALTLAFAHPLLCLMTWPRNHSYYPLFAYGDNRSSVGPPRQ